MVFNSKRIYKDVIYRVNWGNSRHGKEIRIMTGRRVNNAGVRSDVIGVFPSIWAYSHIQSYRLDDGHLPEFQPVFTDYQSVADFLADHPHDEFIENSKATQQPTQEIEQWHNTEAPYKVTGERLPVSARSHHI